MSGPVFLYRLFRRIGFHHIYGLLKNNDFFLFAFFLFLQQPDFCIDTFRFFFRSLLVQIYKSSHVEIGPSDPAILGQIALPGVYF